MAGARIEKRVVAPYVTLDGYIAKLRYRHSTGAKFQDVEVSPKTVLIPVDDLRTIPRHELSLVLDPSALPDVYSGHLEKLALVVLTRDDKLKEEHILYRAPIAALPDSFVLDQARLKRTPARADLPLEINICAVALAGRTAGWPNRRGSRLTSWYLHLTNHSKGPKFPWVRRTAEEFKAKGLPPTSMLYVHILGDPSEMATNPEAMIEELLEVWVHEDAWVALQQPESTPGVAGMQRLVVSQVALQFLELLKEPLAKGSSIEDGSVGAQLLDYVSEHAKCEREKLEGFIRGGKGSVELGPYVTTAFSVNKSMKRVVLD